LSHPARGDPLAITGGTLIDEAGASPAADLVILEHDPVRDIRATGRI
jgi:hypothetical protein